MYYLTCWITLSSYAACFFHVRIFLSIHLCISLLFHQLGFFHSRSEFYRTVKLRNLHREYDIPLPEWFVARCRCFDELGTFLKSSVSSARRMDTRRFRIPIENWIIYPARGQFLLRIMEEHGLLSREPLGCWNQDLGTKRIQILVKVHIN